MVITLVDVWECIRQKDVSFFLQHTVLSTVLYTELPCGAKFHKSITFANTLVAKYLVHMLLYMYRIMMSYECTSNTHASTALFASFQKLTHAAEYSAKYTFKQS